MELGYLWQLYGEPDLHWATQLCSTEYGVYEHPYNRQLHKINICFLLPVFIMPYVLTRHETEHILGNKGNDSMSGNRISHKWIAFS